MEIENSASKVKGLENGIRSKSFQEFKLPDINQTRIIYSPESAKNVLPSSINPSHSKSGFGALINRSPRFNSSKAASPGPGSYHEPRVQTKSISSPFARRFSPVINRSSNPAPGAYNPKLPDSVQACSSSFISKSKRLELTQPISPSPWHYNPNLLKSQSCASIHENLTDHKVKVKKSNSKSKKSNKKITSQGIQALKVLNSLKSDKKYTISQMSLDFNKKNPYDPFNEDKSEQTPGPGLYEVQLQWLKKKKNVNLVEKDVKVVKVHSKALPGPGSYYMDKHVRKEEAKSSFFLNKVPRETGTKKAAAPGPAYYSPKLQYKRVSFAFKSIEEWT